VYVIGVANGTYRTVLGSGAQVERAGVPGRAGAAGFSPGHPGPAGSSGAAVDVQISP
jgi:hypothetical protein